MSGERKFKFKYKCFLMLLLIFFFFFAKGPKEFYYDLEYYSLRIHTLEGVK